MIAQSHFLSFDQVPKREGAEYKAGSTLWKQTTDPFVRDATKFLHDQWHGLHCKFRQFIVPFTSCPSKSRNAKNALPLSYDPDVIAAYFDTKPALVFSRASFIMGECSFFGICFLMDLVLKKVEANSKKRALHLLHLITRLGPTAVKIGQAMSARPDMLPPVYIEVLQNLQDNVLPFSSDEAKELISTELENNVDKLFLEISDEPIAAASLGQVYKAKLKASGQLVAVKVQRPGLLNSIALDLHIIRNMLLGYYKLLKRNPDLVSVLDDWATHFFQELDYIQEANNSERFRREMKSLGNVTVPKAHLQFSSRKVLTSSWIDGKKLSETEAEDASNLVSVALNCYLIQLLETGFMHADPHPGNLLRMADGQLCILDFGLMLEVTEDQRYAFVQYMLHLINADYESAVDDLLKLGFGPAELSSQESARSVLPQFSRVLSQLVRGGGVRKMNVEQIVDDLLEMANEYGIIVPPFFALIFRTYSMLEGIGLKSNPNYVIIKECYPYICKRLLTDDDPRTRCALKYFLYGKKVQVDVQRVESILSGLQSFCQTMLPVEAGKAKLVKSSLDPTSKKVLFSVFAPEGSFLQELLLTEAVRIVDALSRAAVSELLNGLIWAFPLSRILPSFSWMLSINNFVGVNNGLLLSDEDKEALKLVRRLWELAGPQISSQTVSEVTGAARHVSNLTPELASGVTTASMRFMVMLLHRKAVRLADDLDGKDEVTHWNQDPMAWARFVRPVRFFLTDDGCQKSPLTSSF